jgi:hypothetical protein
VEELEEGRKDVGDVRQQAHALDVVEFLHQGVGHHVVFGVRVLEDGQQRVDGGAQVEVVPVPVLVAENELVVPRRRVRYLCIELILGRGGSQL